MEARPSTHNYLFLAGVTLLAIKLGLLTVNKLTDLEIALGGGFFWNFGPLILMIGAGIGSEVLKDKFKAE